MTLTVQPGCRVTLHYTLTLADGAMVDSTISGEPLTLVVGTGELADFLEQRLVGLTAGERRSFELSATETGAANVESAVQRIPRGDFPASLDVRPGEVIGFRMPDGSEVPGQVLELHEAEVLVDFSHPLAGRNLHFDVEIVAIEPA